MSYRSWATRVPGVLVACLIGLTTAQGGDWPQILGPHRNGVADEESLCDGFPAGGPPVLWSREVGEGFAGVAVAQGKGVLFHRVGDRELVECFDPAQGTKLWGAAFPARYSGGIAPDNGPRCVPVIHDDSVYLCGAAGDVHRIRLADGEVVWSRPLYQEVKGSEGYFGAGSTPIVEGKLLLINAGGARGAGLMGLALADGKTVWSTTNELASYSSPTATTREGARQVIFLTRLNCLGINPTDGAVLWKFPFGDRGPTVNAATPLIIQDQVFVSASYGLGARLARFTDRDVREVWSSNDVMSSQYTTSVLHDGFLYGSDGRADQGGARLRCIDPQTGKVRWTEEGFGVAHAILADGKLLLLKEDGTLVLARPSPEEYRELGTHAVLKSTTRALPALAGGRLFVRDTKRLVCLDLRRP